MSTVNEILNSYELSEFEVKKRLRAIRNLVSKKGQKLRTFLRQYWDKHGEMPSIPKMHEHFPTLNEVDLALAQGKALREFEIE